MIHDNSFESWLAGIRGGGFSKRETEILRVLCDARPYILTDREVKSRLGLPDMNSVRPRITELIERGAVVESAPATCKTTRQMVRTLEVARSGYVRLAVKSSRADVKLKKAVELLRRARELIVHYVSNGLVAEDIKRFLEETK